MQPGQREGLFLNFNNLERGNEGERLDNDDERTQRNGKEKSAVLHYNNRRKSFQGAVQTDKHLQVC